MFSHGFGRLAPWLLGIALVISGFAVDATAARAGTLDASWTAPTTNADGSPLTDLASYRLYYGTSPSPCPGPSYVAVASSTPSPGPGETVMGTLTGLTTGTQYYASVTAVDTSGSESDCFTPAQTAVASIDFAVSPSSATSFGSVTVGGLVDQIFTVQNTAGGTISGTVATSAPFSVVSGSSFSLTGVGTTHVVTVRFSPTVAADASTNVTFTTTSGDTISRLVTGTGTGDTTAPTVVITAPTTAATYSTSSVSLALSGTAADNIGVSQVTWANSRGGSGTAMGTTTWMAGGVVLQVGTNVLTIIARDAAGNTATDSLTVTATGDVTVPTIVITAPTTAATYSTSSVSLALSGTAADNIGVSQVTWANSRGGSGTATGTTTWMAGGVVLQVGTNVLTVIARDAAGNTATDSLTVTATGDVTVPTIVITAPTTAATYSTSSVSLALSGTAADNIGVSQVTWANSRGGSGTATGTTTWMAGGVVLQVGTNVLTVTARDGAGNTATGTLTVIATVETTPPTVSLTAPTSGSTVSGIITVSASATDNVSVAGVQFMLDGANLGVEVITAPYTVSWNTTTAAGGAHILTAVARDAAGNTATSTALTVTVGVISTPVLLSNGRFETFTAGVATGWTLITDGVMGVTATEAAGQTGLGQRINIATPGPWGFAFYQQPAFRLNQTYEWTLSYKTSGANAVWAQIVDAPFNNVVLSEELPGTNGVWTQRILTFTYTNAGADRLRISSNAVGSIWIDEFSLREVGAPLLSNGSFESFTGNVATGWTVARDGVVSATVAQDAGQTGFGQRITITSPGAWGLYLHQQPVLTLNQRYEWTFFYKTSAANAVWAQIVDAAFNHVVLSRQLPGTNGVWTQQTLTFVYTNALADQLRISSNAVGTFWLDEFSVREVDAAIVSNGSFESFTGNVATGWTVARDGVVSNTVAQDTGHTGLGQKITITSPGAWGLYLHQPLALTLDQRYEWTFFYKTSGANVVWAQIVDAPFNHVVLSQPLPGTNGVWTQRTLSFVYTNALADQLRISSNAVGTFWLDEFSVRATAP